MSSYNSLAQFYDSLTSDVNYNDWLKWYEHWFKQSDTPVNTVLDLACGTGTLSCMLADKGYSVIGVDASDDMLTEASQKAYSMDLKEVPLFIQQQAQDLNLYGQVDACVSSLDSLNYITDSEILKETFSKIYKFLIPNGMLLFDVLNPEYMRSLDGEAFVDETEDVFCVWRASFNETEQLLTYGMDIFEYKHSNLWDREQEEHVEKAWDIKQLEKMLYSSGFKSVKSFPAFEMRDVSDSDTRLCFVCIK